MAVLWGTSAGLQSAVVNHEWRTAQTGTPTIETSLGVRSNGTSLRFAPGAAKSIQHIFTTTQGAYFARIYFYLVAGNNTNNLTFWSILNGATARIGFRLTNAGAVLKLQLMNFEDSAQIGATSPTLSTGVIYRLELGWDSTTLASTTVEARLYAASDEATLLWNPSGSANLAANPDRWNVGNGNDATLDFTITDCLICDSSGSGMNTWCGQGSLVYLLPDGDSGTPQWARGGTDSGANFSQVNNVPPNDVTSYVQSNTSGQVDLYTLGATPAAVGSGDTIRWVTVGARFAISSTTGGDPDFATRLSSGGNSADSGNLSGAGATAYNSYQTTLGNFAQVLYTKPGGGAFTKADLDGLLAGIVETVTDTHFIRVTELWVIAEHGPAGATLLEVQDATHAHASDGVALEQAHLLAVADASHAHASGNVDVIQEFVLTVQDATHAHTAETPTVEVGSILEVQDATHAHASDTPALTQAHLLAVADVTHSHTSDEVAVTQAFVLTVAEAAHAHASDNVVLEVGADTLLVVQDVTHAHAVETPTPTQAYLLAVQDATHAHASDNVGLSLPGEFTLTVQDVTHAHASDGVGLLQAFLLAVQTATHAHAADSPTVLLNQSLVVADATHAHTSDTSDLLQAYVLAVRDAAHAHAAQSPLLVFVGAHKRAPRVITVPSRGGTAGSGSGGRITRIGPRGQ